MLKIQVPLDIDWSSRAELEENMDVMSFNDEEMEAILDNIAWVNRWLGGDQLTINAVAQQSKRHSGEALRIVDIGCGGGGMCRKLAKAFPRFEIIGVDINEQSLRIAEKKSQAFDNIRYSNVNIFCDEFLELKPDIIVTTLTLHHFNNEEITQLLNQCLRLPKVQIIVNDIHRNPWAFRGFKLVSRIFNLHRCNEIDGLISILRAFTKEDFLQFTEILKKQHPSIETELTWKWAFRYRWIINNL